MQAVLMGGVAAYALWRMTRRAAVPVDETTSYVAVMPSASPVVGEIAQEVAIERAEEASHEDEQITGLKTADEA